MIDLYSEDAEPTPAAVLPPLGSGMVMCVRCGAWLRPEEGEAHAGECEHNAAAD